MIRMGITLRRQLLLQPDWWVIGGLLAGATVLLCLCLAVLVSLVLILYKNQYYNYWLLSYNGQELLTSISNTQILFREYGWPEKLPSPAKYRDLQLKYSMDDYSSKGSRVIALKKTHRNLQVGVNEEPVLRGNFLMKSRVYCVQQRLPEYYLSKLFLLTLKLKTSL